ncbi:MAG: hypothetical protein LBG72_04275 [Spirochaetaceae bacterium]|jgi:hypothetical protein|nr:hypothetical protein [Spirochaetaceae bacterium]
MKMTFGFLFVLSIALTGCDGSIEESGDIPSELAGEWYNKDDPYKFAFAITKDGEGYVAENNYYTVTVAGDHVRFKDKNSSSRELGAFYYDINKTGELSMRTKSGLFKDNQDIQTAASFIKAGEKPQGSALPVELIGDWYSVKDPQSAPYFTITVENKIHISGDSTYYNVPNTNIIGNTVSVFTGSILKGKFDYSIRHGKMTASNGTDICAGLSVLSQFIKK